MKKQDTICWECKRAGLCLKTRIKGIEYIPTKIKQIDGTYLSSCIVTSCPMFLQDRVEKTARQKANELGMNIRTYYKKMEVFN